MQEPVLALRNVSKRFGDTDALSDISFSVSEGHIAALLGPSGCGKTTTLRLVAGFETPDQGQILIGGENMRGKRPYERNVGLLFQDYALFPHMSVAENIAYGLRHRGVNRADAEKRTNEMLQLVRLPSYGPRRPTQLSGGEQQRVALARALAINPKLVLLDEPLSALDAKLRTELRTQLKDILADVGATTIIVTHDQEEAFGLAERVILMNRGHIVQEGAPQDIYLNPANRFAAEFIGRSNLLEGRVHENGGDHATFVTSDGTTLQIPAQSQGGDAAWLCIRPERIVASASDAPRSAPNVLRGTIVDCVSLAADVHLQVSLPSGQRLTIVEKNLGQALRAKGEAVALQVNTADCQVVSE